VPPRSVVVGPGISVPYPVPTSAGASAVGKGNRRANTKPERLLRSELHRRGLRFRTDLRVEADAVRVRVDIAFTRARVAVFVDGCFWHSCPDHGTVPRRNEAYWLPKLKANRARDRRVTQALEDAGWKTIRIWEHAPPIAAADLVAAAVKMERNPPVV
jgi:DNA mismatch endonuclease (patch repair protein)